MEVSIKSHKRRSKTGKTVTVKSYNRKIGVKGVKSGPRETIYSAIVQNKSGDELKKASSEVVRSEISKEELANRLKWEESFLKVEKGRKNMNMSRERYSKFLNNKEKVGKNVSRSIASNVYKPIGVMEKIEDKVANFVEKYSGKKYKRQV